MPREGILGVALDCGRQRALGPALRHRNGDLRPSLLRQPFGVKLQIFRQLRHINRLRAAQRVLFVIHHLQHAAHQLRAVQVFRFVYDEASATQHFAFAHEKHLNCGFQLVSADADHVEVFAPHIHHLLFLCCLLHAAETVSPAGGKLKVEAGSRSFHLLLQA